MSEDRRTASTHARIAELEDQLAAVEGDLARTITAMQRAGTEHCREDASTGRCGMPAEFILWGRLLPADALGPRCREHAAAHLGEPALHQLDQWAVFDLRPLLDPLGASKYVTDDPGRRDD